MGSGRCVCMCVQVGVSFSWGGWGEPWGRRRSAPAAHPGSSILGRGLRALGVSLQDFGLNSE